MDHPTRNAGNDQSSNLESGDIGAIAPTQDAITGVFKTPNDVNVLEHAEFKILAFLVLRKRQVTLRQVHANMAGYSEKEVKSWLITLAMKDMIKVITGDGDVKYVLALAGFVAWDDYPRK